MVKNRKVQSFFDHFPASVAEYCFQLWQDHSFDFVISKERDSKLGDYRFSPKKGHQITVNHNLNPYAFLVTYIHEVAHLCTYLKHKNKVLPHGKEWKEAFFELFEPILDPELLPMPLVKVLKEYLKNPGASSSMHTPLVEVLKTFDPESQLISLHLVKENQLFFLKNLRLIKGKLRRTRYICKEQISGKLYLVAKNAQVSLLENPHDE